MKRLIKERKCGTSKSKYNRFYLADKDLEGTPFEIGENFSYEIDREKKQIRITTDSDLGRKGKVCRQRVGDHHVPLIVIRGKKIEEFAGNVTTMKVTIFEDEIIVVPLTEEKSADSTTMASLQKGFTSLCRNVLSFGKEKEKRQIAFALAKGEWAKRKVANGQMDIFDLGYTLSEDVVTQALAQTETFEQEMAPLTETLRVFEAFAGIGSQRMALQNIGVNHQVVAIAENNDPALKSYQAIHGDCPNLGDITTINLDDIPDHDLFTYSFPCTDVSVEGKQKGLKKGSGTRSATVWDCERIIQAKKPTYLLLENVKNLIGKPHIGEFMKWLDILTTMGYTNYWKVLNSSEHGIPQNRERIFVVSILGPHLPFEFPKPEPLTFAAKDVLEENVDRSYDLNKGYVFDEDESDPSILHIPQATKLGYIPLQVPGICDLSRMDSKSRRGRVQKEGTVTPTLTASEQDICFIDFEKEREGVRIRKLTPKEKWRLFGFKDEDYEKAKSAGVSLAQLSKQAGNSIVVRVLEKLFDQLFRRTPFLSPSKA